MVDDEFTFGVAQPFRRSNWKGTGHRKDGMRGWNAKEFISFDGEGLAVNEPLNLSARYKDIHYFEGDNHFTFDYKPQPQPYILLGNSKGERITRQEGLTTVECLEFLLESKVRYPISIFTAFSFNYDVNQMLADLSEKKLWFLHDHGHVRYKGYWIKWMPGKSFNVVHRPTGRRMMLYDTFGFFQSSFLTACIEYLGEYDPQLELIIKGKEARSAFNWEELDDFIIPYNDAEMEMHVRIMNILRNNLHSVGIDPARWHGPGAVADQVFSINHVPISRDIPEEVLDASQFAYAGGRFELLQMGRHPSPVYEYDIRSAYPAAIVELPNLSAGTWEHVTTFNPVSFGLWRIEYNRVTGDWHTDNRPQPLFCRSKDGSICYPNNVQGWYWTPEARLVDPSAIREGYIFQPDTSDRPFAFVEAMYNERRILKDQKNPSQRALKLALNSFYGKTAQTVGGDDGPPRWHQLEYAGYITSATRAKIYEAMMLDPDAIIAVETDGIFSTKPLDLPLSKELGDWEELVFDEICYLQSGFYYAVRNGQIECKYRGLDTDRTTNQPVELPYDKVLETFQKPWKRHVKSKTHRFNGLGIALHTKAVWRAWEEQYRGIQLYANPFKPRKNKRNHIKEECYKCIRGETMYECLHPLEIGGYSGVSYARSLPWRTVGGPQAILDWGEDLEMNTMLKDMGDDYERWQ